jgi:hypothetical protein
MYTRAKSLPKLYIRNIIPDDMGIPSLAVLAYRGGAMQTFTLPSPFGLVINHTLVRCAAPSHRSMVQSLRSQVETAA